MLEEQRALTDGGSFVEQHEEAAHQKRNWVRLTFDCNDHCIFCLDTDAHDGRMREPEEVKQQILDGRRKGAQRLILSGGEPTIHPRYVDFIKLGRLAGYEKVQTVTNGRMFKYPEFLKACLDAGLQEITFSIHGPNAKVHDALVGVKGAFDEEMTGLMNALEDGRPIINIDVCVNRGNVKHLDAMIEKFVGLGVREFDLLHVIPFGNAWKDGKEVLFYDLEKNREHLVAAFRWAKKPNMHIWLNRFPVAHCEGFHELIQDPYKLHDEVRGRRQEFEHWVKTGEPLDCREPRRCGYCYLKNVCDTFEESQRAMLEDTPEVIRIDTRAEAAMGPQFGGDPASDGRRKKRLPMVALQYAPPTGVAARGSRVLHVVAPDLSAALAAVEPFDLPELVLELDDWSGVEAALEAGSLETLTACRVRGFEDAETLLGFGTFEVCLQLSRDNEDWLRRLETVPARLALFQPTWERLTEARSNDLDLVAFFTEHPFADTPVEGVPACVLGREPRPKPSTHDTAMTTPDGTLEPFRYIRRYVDEHYFVKSLRCSDCRYETTCRGQHVNHIRAFGFDAMQPVPRPAD